MAFEFGQKWFTSRKEQVDGVLLKFRQDGPRRLKVVSDFDFTMTQYWINVNNIRKRGISH